MTTVGIVTPWIAHPELLEGYKAATDRADIVIVVDNGGAPESWGPDVGVVSTGEAQGFAESNNHGFLYVQGDADIVIFLNNDVTADPAWIDLVRDQVEDGALYGPAIGRQRVAGVVLPYVEGWCVAATRETWERLSLDHFIYGEDGPVHHGVRGPWDEERFPKPYWEDVELSLRAMRRGVELRRAPWPIHHLGGVSTATTPGAWDGFEAQRAHVEADVMAITGRAA